MPGYDFLQSSLGKRAGFHLITWPALKKIHKLTRATQVFTHTHTACIKRLVLKRKLCGLMTRTFHVIVADLIGDLYSHIKI